MAYVFLAIAIVAEVVATAFMKQSDGFSRPAPSAIAIVVYCVTFYCFSLALREIPTGIAYAIWAGSGIVLVAAVAWIFQGQKLDAPAVIGMALIILGVAVMQFFSKVLPH